MTDPCIKYKHIDIELLRVSNDSKYIELIFDVPSGYHMTSIQINVSYLADCKNFKNRDDRYEFTKFDGQEQSEWTLKIPVECLGNHIPAMYTITLYAHSDSPDEGYSPDIEDTALVSDINGVYDLLFEAITKPGKCDPISDDAIRNYMLLYGHTAAMYERDIDSAKYFFKYIAKQFANCCQKPSRCSCAKGTPPDNCGCKQPEEPKPKPNLCGCNK